LEEGVKMKIFLVALLVILVLPASALAWHVIGHYGDNRTQTNQGNPWTQQQPERFSGNSQHTGPFRFDNFRGDQGTQIQGFGQRLGPFQFDTFRDNHGNTTNCTTQYIGNQAFTNCR